MASLELLVSPPGTGKTSHCIDLFSEEILKSRGGIDSRSFFVLPSREHAERIQNLLLKKEVSGLFNAHVLTLNDLAVHFSDNASSPAPSESMRTAILRAILAEEAGAQNLSFFGRVADAKGFARVLSAFFSEMRRGLVTTADLEKWCRPLLSKDKVFGLKFGDLSRLAKRYDTAIRERGFAEPEERLAALDRGRPAAELVIIDGFYRFTRAQMALIETLSHGARRMVITLTAPLDISDRPHVFAHAFRTRRELESFGFRVDPASLNVPRRALGAALQHLSHALFSAVPQRLSAGGAIEIIEAPNAREEMRALAREIRRLYRTGSFHWSDFAVILRTIEPYRKILGSALEEFKVPVHIHERRKLIEQGLAQTLARLLRLVRDDWKEADVAFVARSSCRISSAQAQAALELVRSARAAGISDGRAIWEKFLTDPAIGEAARSVLSELLKEEGRFRTAKSAAELSRRLRAWLHAQEKTEEDALVRGALEDILERFGRGEEKAGGFSILRAVEDLIDAIEAGLYSEKPRGRNRVQVYDVVMALPKEYKAVFISGLAEKIFPKETIEEPILRDAERRAVNESAGRVILEERAIRLSGERYFFYMAATRARERLTLTYPAAGLDGRPVLSSIFVEDMRRCFEEKTLPVRRASAEAGAVFWESELEAATGILAEAFLPPSRPDKNSCSYVTAWLSRDDFRAAFLAGLRDPTARIEDPAIRKWFFTLNRSFSASRLETLAACPFRYFAAKVINLNESSDDRTAQERGNVFHRALEMFYGSLSPEERADDAIWKNAAVMAKRMILFLESAFSENAYFKRMPFYTRAVLVEQMKRALARFAREESKLRRERHFVPAYFELEFGRKSDGSPPPRPFLKMGELLIEGKIDRVDLSPDGKSALVVDYKSSKTNFVNKLAKGLELQMPIYWLAVEKLFGLRVVAAEHRHLNDGSGPERIFRASDRALLGKEKGGWEEERVRTELYGAEKRATEAVNGLRKADIAVRPNETCDHCEYSPVCRFEKWKLIYQESS